MRPCACWCGRRPRRPRRRQQRGGGVGAAAASSMRGWRVRGRQPGRPATPTERPGRAPRAEEARGGGGEGGGGAEETGWRTAGAKAEEAAVASSRRRPAPPLAAVPLPRARAVSLGGESCWQAAGGGRQETTARRADGAAEGALAHAHTRRRRFRTASTAPVRRSSVRARALFSGGEPGRRRCSRRHCKRRSPAPRSDRERWALCARAGCLIGIAMERGDLNRLVGVVLPCFGSTRRARGTAAWGAIRSVY